MQKLIMLVCLNVLLSMAAASAAGVINLRAPQTVRVYDTTITCSAPTRAPHPTRESACQRLNAMSEDQAFSVGQREHFGRCWIGNNGPFWGVYRDGAQISPTYNTASNHNPFFNASSYTASTGFVEEVCNGQCY